MQNKDYNCNISITSDDDKSDDFQCIEVVEANTSSEKSICFKTCTGKCLEDKYEQKFKNCAKEKNLASNLLITKYGILPAKIVNAKIKHLVNASSFFASSSHPFHKKLAKSIRKEAKDICILNVNLNERRKSKCAISVQKLYAPYLNKVDVSPYNEKHNEFSSQNEIAEFSNYYSDMCIKENCSCYTGKKCTGLKENASISSSSELIDYDRQRWKQSSCYTQNRRVTNHEFSRPIACSSSITDDMQNRSSALSQDGIVTKLITNHSQTKSTDISYIADESHTSPPDVCKLVGENLPIFIETINLEQENVNKTSSSIDFQNNDRDSAFTTSSPFDHLNQENCEHMQNFSSDKSPDSGTSLSPYSIDNLNQKPEDINQANCVDNIYVGSETSHDSKDNGKILGSHDTNSIYPNIGNSSFDISQKNMETPKIDKYIDFGGNYNSGISSPIISNLAFSTPISTFHDYRDVNSSEVSISECLNTTDYPAKLNLKDFNEYEFQTSNEGNEAKMIYCTVQKSLNEVDCLENDSTQEKINSQFACEGITKNIIDNDKIENNTLKKFSENFNNLSCVTSEFSQSTKEKNISEFSEKFKDIESNTENYCSEKKDDCIENNPMSSNHLSNEEITNAASSLHLINENKSLKEASNKQNRNNFEQYELDTDTNDHNSKEIIDVLENSLNINLTSCNRATSVGNLNEEKIITNSSDVRIMNSVSEKYDDTLTEKRENLNILQCDASEQCNQHDKTSNEIHKNDDVGHEKTCDVPDEQKANNSNDQMKIDGFKHICEDTSREIDNSARNCKMDLMNNVSSDNMIIENIASSQNKCTVDTNPKETTSCVDSTKTVMINYSQNNSETNVKYNRDCIDGNLSFFGVDKDSPDSPVNYSSSDSLHNYNDDDLNSFISNTDILSPSVNDSLETEFNDLPLVDLCKSEELFQNKEICLPSNVSDSSNSNESSHIDEYFPVKPIIQLLVSIPLKCLPKVAICLKRLNKKDLEKLKIKKNTIKKFKKIRKHKNIFNNFSIKDKYLKAKRTKLMNSYNHAFDKNLSSFEYKNWSKCKSLNKRKSSNSSLCADSTYFDKISLLPCKNLLTFSDDFNNLSNLPNEVIDDLKKDTVEDLCDWSNNDKLNSSNSFDNFSLKLNETTSYSICEDSNESNNMKMNTDDESTKNRLNTIFENDAKNCSHSDKMCIKNIELSSALLSEDTDNANNSELTASILVYNANLKDKYVKKEPLKNVDKIKITRSCKKKSVVLDNHSKLCSPKQNQKISYLNLMSLSSSKSPLHNIFSKRNDITPLINTDENSLKMTVVLNTENSATLASVKNSESIPLLNFVENIKTNNTPVTSMTNIKEGITENNITNSTTLESLYFIKEYASPISVNYANECTTPASVNYSKDIGTSTLSSSVININENAMSPVNSDKSSIKSTLVDFEMASVNYTKDNTGESSMKYIKDITDYIKDNTEESSMKYIKDSTDYSKDSPGESSMKYIKDSTDYSKDSTGESSVKNIKDSTDYSKDSPGESSMKYIKDSTDYSKDSTGESSVKNIKYSTDYSKESPGESSMKYIKDSTDYSKDSTGESLVKNIKDSTDYSKDSTGESSMKYIIKDYDFTTLANSTKDVVSPSSLCKDYITATSSPKNYTTPNSSLVCTTPTSLKINAISDLTTKDFSTPNLVTKYCYTPSSKKYIKKSITLNLGIKDFNKSTLATKEYSTSCHSTLLNYEKTRTSSETDEDDALTFTEVCTTSISDTKDYAVLPSVTEDCAKSPSEIKICSLPTSRTDDCITATLETKDCTTSTSESENCVIQTSETKNIDTASSNTKYYASQTFGNYTKEHALTTSGTNDWRNSTSGVNNCTSPISKNNCASLISRTNICISSTSSNNTEDNAILSSVISHDCLLQSPLKYSTSNVVSSLENCTDNSNTSPLHNQNDKPCIKKRNISGLSKKESTIDTSLSSTSKVIITRSMRRSGNMSWEDLEHDISSLIVRKSSEITNLCSSSKVNYKNECADNKCKTFVPRQQNLLVKQEDESNYIDAVASISEKGSKRLNTVFHAKVKKPKIKVSENVRITRSQKRKLFTSEDTNSNEHQSKKRKSKISKGNIENDLVNENYLRKLLKEVSPFENSTNKSTLVVQSKIENIGDEICSKKVDDDDDADIFPDNSNLRNSESHQVDIFIRDIHSPKINDTSAENKVMTKGLKCKSLIKSLSDGPCTKLTLKCVEKNQDHECKNQEECKCFLSKLGLSDNTRTNNGDQKNFEQVEQIYNTTNCGTKNLECENTDEDNSDIISIFAGDIRDLDSDLDEGFSHSQSNSDEGSFKAQCEALDLSFEATSTECLKNALHQTTALKIVDIGDCETKTHGNSLAKMKDNLVEVKDCDSLIKSDGDDHSELDIDRLSVVSSSDSEKYFLLRNNTSEKHYDCVSNEISEKSKSEELHVINDEIGDIMENLIQNCNNEGSYVQDKDDEIFSLEKITKNIRDEEVDYSVTSDDDKDTNSNDSLGLQVECKHDEFQAENITSCQTLALACEVQPQLENYNSSLIQKPFTSIESSVKNENCGGTYECPNLEDIRYDTLEERKFNKEDQESHNTVEDRHFESSILGLEDRHVESSIVGLEERKLNKDDQENRNTVEGHHFESSNVGHEERTLNKEDQESHNTVDDRHFESSNIGHEERKLNKKDQESLNTVEGRHFESSDVGHEERKLNKEDQESHNTVEGRHFESSSIGHEERKLNKEDQDQESHNTVEGRHFESSDVGHEERKLNKDQESHNTVEGRHFKSRDVGHEERKLHKEDQESHNTVEERHFESSSIGHEERKLKKKDQESHNAKEDCHFESNNIGQERDSSMLMIEKMTPIKRKSSISESVINEVLNVTKGSDISTFVNNSDANSSCQINIGESKVEDESELSRSEQITKQVSSLVDEFKKQGTFRYSTNHKSFCQEERSLCSLKRSKEEKIFSDKQGDSVSNTGKCSPSSVDKEEKSKFGTSSLCPDPEEEDLEEGEIIKSNEDTLCQVSDVHKAIDSIDPALKYLECPVLPKGHCFKHFMENGCYFERCLTLHTMEVDMLIRFLGELLPYYLERGLISLAWSILETQIRAQNGNGFLFSVSVLKPLASILLSDPEFVANIPDFVQYSLMAAKLEILCAKGNGRAAFQMLYDNYATVGDITAKKLMFFLFIRFCEIHSDINTSPFQRVINWGFFAGFPIVNVNHFQLELDSYWLLFHIFNNNENTVFRCYRLLNEVLILDPEYFTAITSIFLNFIEKTERIPDLVQVFDHLVNRKIKNPKIFVMIASILKRHTDKAIVFRFFGTMFVLEPSFSVVESIDLVDLALQYDIGLAVNTVSYIVQACRCEPLIPQTIVIIEHLKNESGIPDWGLVKKLCFSLSPKMLKSIMKPLQYLLRNVHLSPEDLDVFVAKMNAKGCSFVSSIFGQSCDLNKIEMPKENRVNTLKEVSPRTFAAIPPPRNISEGDPHCSKRPSFQLAPEVISTSQPRQFSFDSIRSCIVSRQDFVNKSDVGPPRFCGVSPQDFKGDGGLPRSCVVSPQDFVNKGDGGASSSCSRSERLLQELSSSSSDGKMVSIKTRRSSSLDTERAERVKKLAGDLEKAARSDDPTERKEHISKVFIDITQSQTLVDVDQTLQSLGVFMSGSRMENCSLEEEQKTVLGLLGSALIVHCIFYKLPNQAASMIITLRNLDIKFHEYQTMFMVPPPSQQRLAMMGIQSLFTSSKFAPIEIILRDVDWRGDSNEAVCKENLKTRLSIIKDMCETLLREKQNESKRILSFFIQLIRFLVELYQYDNQVIGLATYQDVIDLPELLRAVVEWHLEVKQLEFLFELEELILAFKRNDISIPTFVEEHPALDHLFSPALERDMRSASSSSFSSRIREAPFTDRRLRPVRGAPAWNLRNNQRVTQESPYLGQGHGAIRGSSIPAPGSWPLRIHQRIEWPNHVPQHSQGNNTSTRRGRNFRVNRWERP